MPCDRRHSPTVRSCQEPARIGRKHNHSCQCLSSSRYVDGIKVLAEQFNQSVLAMVRKAAERVSPADTLGNRRRRRRGDRPLGRRSVRVMRLPAAERELSHSPRIFHGGCTVCLNIGSELLKLWCAILGLNQSFLSQLAKNSGEKAGAGRARQTLDGDGGTPTPSQTVYAKCRGGGVDPTLLNPTLLIRRFWLRRRRTAQRRIDPSVASAPHTSG